MPEEAITESIPVKSVPSLDFYATHSHNLSYFVRSGNIPATHESMKLAAGFVKQVMDYASMSHLNDAAEIMATGDLEAMVMLNSFGQDQNHLIPTILEIWKGGIRSGILERGRNYHADSEGREFFEFLIRFFQSCTGEYFSVEDLKQSDWQELARAFAFEQNVDIEALAAFATERGFVDYEAFLSAVIAGNPLKCGVL